MKERKASMATMDVWEDPLRGLKLFMYIQEILVRKKGKDYGDKTH